MKTLQANPPAVISLDMGTSSIRACLVDESLNILLQHSVNVQLESGLDGRAEQDAEEVTPVPLTWLVEWNPTWSGRWSAYRSDNSWWQIPITRTKSC